MRALFVALVAITLAACESVPDITFEELDGGADAHLSDARASDAPSSGDSDASAPACTADSIPPGTNACCYGIPCVGDCTPGDCQKCVAACVAAGLVCCSTTHPVACVTPGTPCP